MSVSQTILNIAEICARHEIKQLVLSPGSRNAPLLLAFSRHPKIKIRVIPDERSAAYVALGMAQSTGQPVILLSTSGTAALNFGPAIAEAYYQSIPLLVFTADRPPEWVDQNDGQSIRQTGVFQHHVKKSFALPVSLVHEDEQWFVQRTINEAIITSQTDNPGPVHINAPFREPLYPATDQSWEYDRKVAIVRKSHTRKDPDKNQWQQLVQQWEKAEKVMLVAGQMRFSESINQSVEALIAKRKVTVIGDITANLHQAPKVIKHSELILEGTKKLATLRPDLLVTFGGGIISKSFKLFLRKYPPIRHWHIQEAGYPPDTFKSLTQVINTRPAAFLTRLTSLISEKGTTDWYRHWQEQEQFAKSCLEEFLDNQPFNELQGVQMAIHTAGEVHLHLANSSAVRWANLAGATPETIEISSNRGTSGIDGCSSSAVGHSLVNNRQNLLITGDMAFLYDRNAFWHQYKLPNLKIILLNNHGGGIFRLIDGPKDQPELEEFFVTNQEISAENTARDFGMKYLYCHHKEDLATKLAQLYEPNDHASLLEVEFSNNMAEIYRELKAKLQT